MDSQTVEAPAQAPVIVLADDLIWSSRLVAAVERAGARSVRAGGVADLATRLAELPAACVIVDLNGRGYDGVAAVGQAAAAGAAVLAVGQHEDVDLRKRALAAGAQRVFSYNKLFSDGPAVVVRLLEGRL